MGASLIWLLVFRIRKEISIQLSLTNCHFQVVDILKTSGSPDLFSPELDAGDTTYHHQLNQQDNHDHDDDQEHHDYDHADRNVGDDDLADIDIDHS